MKRLLLCLLFILTAPSFAIDLYSNRELDDLKKEFITEVNRSPQLIRDPLALRYLNQLGHRLTHANHLPNATFFIVNSSEINAFAGPGGYIGLHSTLILATQNEDELASVMAHELAHVSLHHLYDMIEHEKLMRIPTMASLLAAMALGTLNPMLGSGAMAATLSGAAQHSINYTRSHEKEADRIGVQFLIRAGLDPHAMAHFFRKLQQSMQYYDTASIPALLRTHPLDEERIAEVEGRTAHLHAPPPALSLDYELFKVFIRHQTLNAFTHRMTYYTQQTHPHALNNQYGQVLAYLEANQPEQARQHLTPLLAQAPNNAFLTHAKAQIELAEQHPDQAIHTLQTAQTPATDPAVALMLADAHLKAHRPQQAAQLLTKAFRQHPKHLMLCMRLAQAESSNHRPAYAYFIQAHCDHLQGEDRLALRRLHEAAALSQQDPYLKARIDAKRAEIQENLVP